MWTPRFGKCFTVRAPVDIANHIKGTLQVATISSQRHAAHLRIHEVRLTQNVDAMPALAMQVALGATRRPAP